MLIKSKYQEYSDLPYSFRELREEENLGRVKVIQVHHTGQYMRAPTHDMGSQVAEYVSKCVNLKVLDYDFTKEHMGDDGVQAVGSAIQKTKQLEVLILQMKWNDINPYIYKPEFANGILASRETLKVIHLDFGDNNVKDGYASNIMKSVLECSNLKSIAMGFKSGSLTSNFSSSLKGLENLKELRSLYLDLSYNSFEDDKTLAKHIKETSNLEELVLNLRKNNLSYDSLLFIEDKISNMISLKKLHLNLMENNLESKKKQQTFGMNLQRLKNLEDLTLEMGWTNFTPDHLVNLLQNVQLCPSLIEFVLDFKWNQLFKINDMNLEFSTKNGPLALHLQKLTLNLRNNKLTPSGLQNLILFANNLPALNTLIINAEANQLSQNIEVLSSALSKLKVPKLTLNLEDNDLTNKSLISLLTDLSNNNDIQSLQLQLTDNEQFTIDCYEEFGHQLSKFKKLNELNLIMPKNDTNQTFMACKYMFQKIFKSKSIHSFKLKQYTSYDNIYNYSKFIRSFKKATRLVQYQFEY